MYRKKMTWGGGGGRGMGIACDEFINNVPATGPYHPC